jgi:hypothetical protein
MLGDPTRCTTPVSDAGSSDAKMTPTRDRASKNAPPTSRRATMRVAARSLPTLPTAGCIRCTYSCHGGAQRGKGYWRGGGEGVSGVQGKDGQGGRVRRGGGVGWVRERCEFWTTEEGAR